MRVLKLQDGWEAAHSVCLDAELGGAGVSVHANRQTRCLFSNIANAPGGLLHTWKA